MFGSESFGILKLVLFLWAACTTITRFLLYSWLLILGVCIRQTSQSIPVVLGGTLGKIQRPSFPYLSKLDTATTAGVHVVVGQKVWVIVMT